MPRRREVPKRKIIPDPKFKDKLVAKFHYVQAKDDAGYANLKEVVRKLQAEHKTGDNVLFYFAVSPKIFGLISGNLAKAGFKDASAGGWRFWIATRPWSRRQSICTASSSGTTPPEDASTPSRTASICPRRLRHPARRPVGWSRVQPCD